MKDKFTRAELAEFTIGAFITVFLSYSVLDRLAGQVDILRSIFLLVLSISIASGLIYLKKIEHPIRRLLLALAISSLISIPYLAIILQKDITSLDFVPLYLLAISASTIGALTIDILEED